MYIHTIHNALAEAVCVVVFQEIQNFHYDVGHQGVEIYPCIKFCLSQCFPSSVTCTYICMYWPRLLSKKYIFMTKFVTSQLYSLPSFMFVSAAVSEIHDLNQNKEKNNFENKKSIYHLSQAYN